MTKETPFKGIIHFADVSPPGRAYIHRAGLKEVFGSESAARNYFKQEYDSTVKHYSEKYDFVIAVLWGSFSHIKHRNIDVFGFHGLNGKWPGNPDVSNFVMVNGIFQPLEKPTDITTCGDTLILLGKEEEYRRTTSGLDVYMNIPPTLEGLLTTD